ncbi:hypothetical protein [Nesterenkonia sphaerica]|uniref:Uncharacterized protein n=1 Tax=Nesterenkonia sphaerica TaxID=1804988 RepID=A0A5R9A3W4_9MICC|nr:hypothetical protein [Nesterenkonia sphaerica]TLP73308.1 hypothetical protein FEF27_10415 [Nesterenkonia sphaerica]
MLHEDVRAQLELREEAMEVAREISASQSTAGVSSVNDHISRGEYAQAATRRKVSAREEMYRKARAKASERDQGLSL